MTVNEITDLWQQVEDGRLADENFFTILESVQPRPWFLFLFFWNKDAEWFRRKAMQVKHVRKLIFRILFIIEKRLKRFEGFRKKAQEGESWDLWFQPIAKARQAVAWYQYLWYGISEPHWRYGTDKYERAVRKKYLEERKEKRRQHKRRRKDVRTVSKAS